jgi:hypothetical protein
MKVNELKEKIREIYKLINYQNVEFEWNDNLKKARKICNEIQSKLHQPTVIKAVCELDALNGDYCENYRCKAECDKCDFWRQTDL